MLMNRLAAQQEFLPTDLMMETPIWHYGAAALLFVLGVLWLIPAKGAKEEGNAGRGVFGGMFLILGVVLFGVSWGSNFSTDSKQNFNNFEANVKAVYSVDDVTALDLDLDNGDTIKIHADGRTYEVIANWDPDTYEPTLYPTTAGIEDLEALKK